MPELQLNGARLRRYNWPRLSWVISAEVALVLFLATFFLNGANDLYQFYVPFAQGCLPCGYVPYPAQWSLWPAGWLNYPWAWPFWTALTLIGLLAVCRFTGANPALLLLSFPAIGQIWLGQVDVVLCIGLALMVLAPSPYARGVGVALALTKPQVAGIAIFYLLISEPRQNWLKLLTAPLAAFALSLIVYGPNWPLEWLAFAQRELPVHVWRLAALDMWKFGWPLLIAPFFIRERRTKIEAALLITPLATPFIGVYSYLVFLIFRNRWWALPLSFAWVLAYPLWQDEAMRLAWVLPAALLAELLYAEWRKNQIKVTAT